MFMENYRDQNAAMITAGGGAIQIPYPRISEEDWGVWCWFLPHKSQHFKKEAALKRPDFLKISYGIPYQLTKEIQKAAEYFDEIEVWGKREVYKDPIAVGLRDGQRYLIARWGMDKLVSFETIKDMKSMPLVLAWKYGTKAVGIVAGLAGLGFVAWGFLS